MKTRLFFLMLVLILALVSNGCNQISLTKPELNTQKDIKEAKNKIEESSNIIERAADDITKEANKITTEATEAQSKIPEEAKSKITPHLDIIKESAATIVKDTTKINKASSELDGAKSLLDNAEKKVSVIEGVLDKIAKERDQALIDKKKAEEARDSALHKAIKWLILASIVGAGALGVFGILYGSKVCLTLAATCVVIMSVAIFVETYFIYLVIFGAIILVALLAVLIYNIVIQKRAFSQVVDTVEVTQENLSKENKEKLFGGVGQTGIMNKIQSKSTMDLIKKEKLKMSNLWNYAKTNGVK